MSDKEWILLNGSYYSGNKGELLLRWIDFSEIVPEIEVKNSMMCLYKFNGQKGSLYQDGTVGQLEVSMTLDS